MTDKEDSKHQEWIPFMNMKGEYSLEESSYDATNLFVKLLSFESNEYLYIRFLNVFSFNITLEHLRWRELKNTYLNKCFYEVKNSKYLQWILDAGMLQLYDNNLNITHFVIFTTEHIIDVLSSTHPIIDDNAPNRELSK